MANIVGTAGNDVLVGTVGNDQISGLDGNDRINGGDGDDFLVGGVGNDYVYGDAGRDILHGGSGDDAIVGDAGDDQMFGGDGRDGMFGGGGNDVMMGDSGVDTMYGDGGDDWMDGGVDDDKLFGGTGNDRLFGGAGNDLLDGQAGDDTLVYQIGTGVDQLLGNTGVDTLELVMSGAQLAVAYREISDFVRWLDAQIAAVGGNLAALAAQAAGPTFTFASLGLSVSAVEKLDLIVDGQRVDLDQFRNVAPVADPQASIVTVEDRSVTGAVGASDADGDPLTHSLAAGPQHGSVTLDAVTGAFVYTPDADYAGNDSFTVTVTDPAGASVTQTVSVEIGAVADAPQLAVADASVMVGGATIEGTDAVDVLYGTAGADLIIGNAGDDIIYSDGAPDGYAAALDIAAALTDRDGSETLVIEISGVPTGASLSAGVMVSDGVWRVDAGSLAGLTMTLPEPVAAELTVTASAVEANGSVATSVGHISVAFEGLDGDGADILRGGAGNDQMFGGEGLDFVDYSTTGNGVYVSLAAGVAYGDGFDTMSGIEGIIGSSYNDTLLGDDGDNIVYAGDGNDQVRTYEGNDLVFDGDGTDLVFAGSGDDRIVAADGDVRDRYHGDFGFDVVDYSAVTGAISVDLGNGNVRGAAGRDLLFGIEGVIGGSGNDTLLGGHDRDTLNGGAGNDLIGGGRGADILTGGIGADTFVFARNDYRSKCSATGFDTITDFEAGDQLDFSGFRSGNRPIDIAHDVHATDTAAGTMVSIDLGRHQGVVDVVLLEGVHGLGLDGLMAGGYIIG